MEYESVFEYQDCLNACISRLSNIEGAVAMYQAYPLPSQEEWSECRKRAHQMAGLIATPLDYMAAYEMKLINRGLATVTMGLIEKKINVRNLSAVMNVVKLKLAFNTL